MPEPQTLANVNLKKYPHGARIEVRLEANVDPRVLLMMAHDLLTALEQKGYLSATVAQAKPFLAGQLKEWGFVPGHNLSTASGQVSLPNIAGLSP